jgi:hypothetical protein
MKPFGMLSGKQKVQRAHGGIVVWGSGDSGFDSWRQLVCFSWILFARVPSLQCTSILCVALKPRMPRFSPPLHYALLSLYHGTGHRASSKVSNTCFHGGRDSLACNNRHLLGRHAKSRVLYRTTSNTLQVEPVLESRSQPNQKVSSKLLGQHASNYFPYSSLLRNVEFWDAQGSYMTSPLL